MRDDPFTIALHADDDVADLGDVAPPIRPSTTFARGGADTYRRDSHETVRRLEAVLGALDGGEAVVYPSGMGAVGAVLRYLRPARIALP
jgi:cystathionine beta-lyase/cystathionine gamma-synthase